MQKIVLASNNKGKLAEFQQLFAPLGVELINQGALGVGECEEPYFTFLENALTKARFASQATGLPAIADDSGLVVPALGGAPGVLSARYAQTQGGEKSDSANNAYLLKALENIADRRGFYVACLVFVRHVDDPCPIVAQAFWSGEIAREARGEYGFGYDPYFYLPDLGKTAAELLPEQKNSISHRGQALQKLLAELKAYV
ncbi:RdgB/HAM1 family non-canonical purine NTP pyrophosphatase [Pelistega suis]|uniref:RdgB/HAM1 family non-canonical purine NTP pyrophosphatase n=1 Tax=Pelistega suis TaxID=1631957 RepID=UPI00211C9CC1|nr:RdgB/HAM1 family non-canonical purine NTP pyrophosphatase [Pelistega suis]MCQ9329847.1 RdgB/HAM1 family non-canonical purine NTP pyrophosphatase [Pelistega suis]MDY3332024.1 RdgB/HAM1 family non-canonical purine NTP pyrophosphatase [Pelistega sp.]